jgi:hypothetical protein
MREGSTMGIILDPRPTYAGQKSHAEQVWGRRRPRSRQTDVDVHQVNPDQAHAARADSLSPQAVASSVLL